MEEEIIREEPFGEHVDQVEPAVADEDQHALQRVYMQIKALERFPGRLIRMHVTTCKTSKRYATYIE